MRTIVVAADSNLIGIAPAEKISDKTKQLAGAVASLVNEADRVVFCHGGAAEVRYIHDVMAEGAKEGIDPGAPVDACIAMSEGYLGFHLLEVLEQALRDLGREDVLPVGALLTQVDSADDAGLPQILEKSAILTLLKEHPVLLAGGSGGIPVVKGDNGWAGGEKVLDLPPTAAAMAIDTGADRLVFLVDDQQTLPEGPLTADAAEEMSGQKDVPPRVVEMLKSASRFVRSARGRSAILSPVSSVAQAVNGEQGLLITGS